MNTPTPLQVKEIFKDTYLFYLKYINITTDSEFQSMIKEANEILKKYPFKLCEGILLETCNIIEEYAKSKVN